MNRSPEKELTRIATAVADRKDHVQGAGGNISVKLGSQMWIKASGKTFGQINEREGYVVLQHSPIAEYFYRVTDDRVAGESDSLKVIASNVLHSGNQVRPSMETGFHAILGNVVLHTHSLYANLLNCRKDPETDFNKISSLLNYSTAWLEYYSPGFALSKAIAQMGVNQSSVIFLKNHGIVIQAETTDKVLEILNDTDLVFQNYYHSREFNSKEYSRDEGLFTRYLFPDQVVYFNDPSILDLEWNESRCEMAAAWKFISDSLGGECCFLSTEEVAYIRNMEMEKFRKKQNKIE